MTVLLEFKLCLSSTNLICSTFSKAVVHFSSGMSWYHLNCLPATRKLSYKNSNIIKHCIQNSQIVVPQQQFQIKALKALREA